MSVFKATAELHNREVTISELTIKDLKVILKSIIYIDSTPFVFFDTLNSVLAIKTSLSLQEIRNLNIVDYVILILSIKSISTSSEVKIVINDGDTSSSMSIDISKFIDTLKSIDLNTHIRGSTIQGINIQYKIPTIQEIFMQDDDLISSFMFVESVGIDTNRIAHINKLSRPELLTLRNNLPVKIKKEIDKVAINLYKYFNTVNLLSVYNTIRKTDLIFNFNKDNMILLFSIIFNENLMVIYQNMFMLCKYSNLAAEYVESITPGEYNIFVSLLEAFLSKDEGKDENIRIA